MDNLGYYSDTTTGGGSWYAYAQQQQVTLAVPANFAAYQQATAWTTWVTANATGINQQVWRAWQPVYQPGAPSLVYDAPETAVQRQARLQREAEIARGIAAQQIRHNEQQARVREADQRATALLESSLTPDELKAWREHGRIIVVSQHARRYQVRRGTSHNVCLLGDGDRLVESYCAHPEAVPTDDVVLAQLLFLKYAEDEFLRVANRQQLLANCHPPAPPA